MKIKFFSKFNYQVKMKLVFFVTLLLYNLVAADCNSFVASFISKQSNPPLPSTGVQGITMNQQIGGVEGYVQISVDAGVVPINSKLGNNINKTIKKKNH